VNVYRIREHLTEAETDKLLAALKCNRHGHRDGLIGLVIYRHGLRVSEACDLRWDDIDLPKRTIIVRRLKGSTDSVHYLERDEVNGFKLLHRQQQADGIKAAYVFINERGQPFGRMGIGRMIERAGEAAGLLGCRSRCMSTCCATRRDTHWRPGIIAAPAPVFLMGVSHSKPASRQLVGAKSNIAVFIAPLVVVAQGIPARLRRLLIEPAARKDAASSLHPVRMAGSRAQTGLVNARCP
jgi:Phage integrase family